MNARAKRRGGFEAIRKMVRGLRKLAEGAVLARTILRISAYFRGRVKGELRRHVKTGRALRTALVLASDKSVNITLQRYRRYIKWSFAKGIPASAIKRSQAILGEELAKVADGGGG